MTNTEIVFDAAGKTSGPRWHRAGGRAKGSRPLLITPANQMVAFDFLFFFNYFQGWMLTIIFNNEFTWNNPVARVFKVYNICIGVDSFPAQPVAAIIWLFGFSFFWESTSLYMMRNYEIFVRNKDSMELKGKLSYFGRQILLFVGLAGAASFGLTYAIPPNPDPEYFDRTQIHVYGFAFGLMGYAMIKLAVVLEFYDENGEKWLVTRNDKIYVATNLTMFLFFLIFSLGLFVEMSKATPSMLTEHITKADVKWDNKGTMLILLSFFGPILTYWFKPASHPLRIFRFESE